MNNRIKLFGIIAISAVIGFSMTARGLRPAGGIIHMEEIS